MDEKPVWEPLKWGFGSVMKLPYGMSLTVKKPLSGEDYWDAFIGQLHIPKKYKSEEEAKERVIVNAKKMFARLNTLLNIP